MYIYMSLLLLHGDIFQHCYYFRNDMGILGDYMMGPCDWTAGNWVGFSSPWGLDQNTGIGVKVPHLILEIY